MKIVRIATVPFFLQNHLRAQIIATSQAGHEVTLVSSGGPEVQALTAIPGIRFEQIEIPRRISPLKDLLALWKLWLFFRRERFDIMHSTTPKAGMLCAVAALLARVPIRLHTFTGQAWMELHGLQRALARMGDWLTAHLDTRCYADSFSQRDFLLGEGIADEKRLSVLGAGSLAGVDLERFDPEAWTGQKTAIAAELGIRQGVRVITFIGRVTRDKGIDELVSAFESLRSDGVDCVLLLVGPLETESAPLSATTMRAIETSPDIRCLGYSGQPERYLALTDVFCLPSYREGFGNVAIEAAAMGVPTVGTDIIGLKDAVIDGETGLLVPPKDPQELARALSMLLSQPSLRESMGARARARVLSLFDAKHVNAALLDEYQRISTGGQ